MSENGFFKSLPGIISGEKLRLNKKLVMFFIFVGIATFLWFLWTMEKEYTSVISNPVEFTKLPENRVLVNNLPDKLHMEVTGGGFALLRHNWDISKTPIKIDFQEIYQGQFKNSQSGNIVLSLNQIRTRFSAQLTNIKVNSVIPDTVSFSFASLVKKTVPVRADLELELEKQFMVRGGVIVTPDSIEISGPSVVLDTIHEVYTSPLKLKKVETTTQRNLSLVQVHDKISLSKKRVQVEIPVEQFTEKTIETGLITVNVPDSLILRLFPANVNVTFRVVMSEFEKSKPESFLLGVDYNHITEGDPSRIRIQIFKSPEFISNIRINPETVDYILENK